MPYFANPQMAHSPDDAALAIAHLDRSRLHLALTEREEALARATAALRQLEVNPSSRLWRLVQAIQGQVTARPWLHRSLRRVLAGRHWLSRRRATDSRQALPPEASLLLRSGLFDAAVVSRVVV